MGLWVFKSPRGGGKGQHKGSPLWMLAWYRLQKSCSLNPLSSVSFTNFFFCFPSNKAFRFSPVCWQEASSHSQLSPWLPRARQFPSLHPKACCAGDILLLQGSACFPFVFRVFLHLFLWKVWIEGYVKVLQALLRVLVTWVRLSGTLRD